MLTTADRHLTFLLQEALAKRGLPVGPADGLFGAKTAAAFEQFRSSYTFAPSAKPAPVQTKSPIPAWLTIARGELGVSEIPGSRDNPRIVEYHQSCTLKATDDETPWCSAFVNWCLQQAGYPGTRNAMARSFLDYPQVLAQPQPGCIVVFRRGNPPSGHVAFVDEVDGLTLCVLGGNQGDKVSRATYSRSLVLGYRWPV